MSFSVLSTRRSSPASTELIDVWPGVKYDLDKVFSAVDRVIDLIGPHPCISGFDVLFRNELIVINEQLQGEKF